MTERDQAADPTDPDHPPARAGWREWVGLAVLTLPMLVLATDLSVLFLAMPSITADLQPSTSQMLWILHVYGLLIGAFLITMGRLGDRLGRRRLLFVGATAFGVLALAAAYSPNAEVLIVVRGLLGVAGATLMPSAYSLLRNMFTDPGQRRFAIATMLGAFVGGSALGPVLGGTLLAFFWWGAVFLVNIPPLVLLLAVGRTLLPEYREPVRTRLDLPSVALSLGAVLAIVFGLQELAEHGPRLPYLGAVVAGAGLGAVFVRRQLRITDPLLDLTLFRDRRFSAALGSMVCSGLGLLGGFYLFSQHLQWVRELTPLQAGMWMVPFFVASLAGSMLAPMLARWLRPATMVGGGLLLAAVGLAFAALVSGSASLPVVLIGLSVMALGQGASMAIASDLIVSTAPLERAGSAASMQEVSGELGSALGIAFGGAAGMAVYRHVLADRADPAVPTEVLDTARDHPTAAQVASADLPGTLGVELVATAQQAFSVATQVGLGIGAVTLVLVGTATALLLRGTVQVGTAAPAPSGPPPADDRQDAATAGSARGAEVTP